MISNLWLGQSFDELFARPLFLSPTLISDKRWEKWLALSNSFPSKDLWLSYLEQWHLDESQFRSFLLSSQDELSEKVSSSSWQPQVQLWMTSFDQQTLLQIPEHLTLFRSLIMPSLSELASAESLTARADYFDAPKVLESLLQNLLPRLEALWQRTFALELQIAHLDGATSQSSPESTSLLRYHDFIEKLSSAEMRESVLNNYPLLLRDAVLIVDHWREASLEFLERFLADRDQLLKTFRINASSRLSGVLKAGDAHRSGRAVFILAFEEGTKLVYKPRSLASDAAFQDILTWMNHQGLRHSLMPHQILNRGNYGWAEYIQHQSCEHPADVNHFYFRQGALLAIFYALGASDFHYENLIACGSHPVAIDLETLFQPRLLEDEIESKKQGAIFDFIHESVLSIGMLPAPKADGTDNSSLGASQGAGESIDTFVRMSTGRAQLSKVPLPPKVFGSLPFLNDQHVSLDDYQADLKKGFAAALEILMQNREELLSPESPLHHFRKLPQRVLIRPSVVYGQILRECSHPQVLRNGAARELRMAQLWKAEGVPLKVCASERRQLWNKDIPIFYAVPNSKRLQTADGEFIADAITESGWERVQVRLKGLIPREINKQLNLIDLAFACKGFTSLASRVPRAQQTPQTLLECAELIGERLLETAIHEKDGGVTWIAALPFEQGDDTNRNLRQLRPLGGDLYRGTAGISLFLALLAELSGRSNFKDLALAALKKTEGLGEGASKSVSAVHGVASLVYLYTQLSHLWRDADLAERAINQLGLLETMIAGDQQLDTINGVAGVIPVLLSLAELRPDCAALSLAIRCGDHLLTMEKAEVGIHWPDLSMRRGFSHGLSGLSFSLARLADATGDERFTLAALRAARLERGLIKESGWSDLQEQGERHFWCHGSPGIALSRLHTLGALKSPVLRQELRDDAEAAFAVARARAMPHTASILCHGDLGNAETWLAAEAVLQSLDAMQDLKEIRARMLTEFNKSEWTTRPAGSAAEPGLFTGIAGIGYGLLRLACPDRVPSVLTLSL